MTEALGRSHTEVGSDDRQYHVTSSLGFCQDAKPELRVSLSLCKAFTMNGRSASLTLLHDDGEM